MATHKRFERVEAPAPALSTRAAVLPDSLDLQARTVDVVWTTGERVMRGFFNRFLEELSLAPDAVRMDRLASGNAPVLNSHRAGDARNVVGVVTSARLEANQGVATLQFADDNFSSEIFRKISTGILRNVSVGYRVHRFEQIQGGESEIPVFRAVDWEPMEISVVPIPADANANVRGEADGINSCEFFRLARENEMATNTPTPSAPETPIAVQPETRAPDPVPPADVTAEQREQIRLAERERVQTVRRVATQLGLGTAFADEHIAAGTEADAVRVAAFAAYEQAQRATAQTPAPGLGIEPGETDDEKWARGASNWIIQRAGATAYAKAAYETFNVGDKDLDPGEFRGMSLIDLARESLERRGIRTRGLSRMELVGQAFIGRGGPVVGGASTGDFPVLLENTLHKTLLGAYAITQDKWSRFCAVGTVSDFRVHNRYRQGTFSRLDKVLEAGEFRNKEIPDARKETIIAETFGNIIAITRQTIVNDDMGAFNSLAARLGRAAALSIEVDIFALLAENGGLGPLMNDGLPLFDPAHNNIGAGAPLSIAAIDSNLVTLASQVDESGNEVLELEPAILLVHRAQESQALNINGSEFNVDDDALGSTKSRVPNVVRGKFRDVVASTRLADTTRRYIFTEPGETPTLEVAFLDGQQSPVLEMQEGWRVDGMEWKVRLDYGVAGVDYRGAVTDAGV